jgi:hypothetical protein
VVRTNEKSQNNNRLAKLNFSGLPLLVSGGSGGSGGCEFINSTL